MQKLHKKKRKKKGYCETDQYSKQHRQKSSKTRGQILETGTAGN